MTSSIEATPVDTPRRNHKPIIIAAAVIFVMVLAIVGWNLRVAAQQRAAIEDAQATFDAAIAACEAERDTATASTVEALTTTRTGLENTVKDARTLVESDTPVADPATVETLAENITIAVDLLDAEETVTTEPCLATPDEILGVDPVTIDVPTGSALAEQLTQHAAKLSTSIAAVEQSQLKAGQAALSDAIESAQKAVDDTEGQVADNATREALRMAIAAATETSTKPTVTLDQLAAAETSLDKPRDAVTASHSAWQDAQAAAAQHAAAATTGNASTGAATSSTSASNSTKSQSNTKTSTSSTTSDKKSSSTSTPAATAKPTPAPAPKPTPAPAPKPAVTKVDEWGGKAYSADRCFVKGSGWADTLASARATAQANTSASGAWHLTGTSNDITITLYGCSE